MKKPLPGLAPGSGLGGNQRLNAAFASGTSVGNANAFKTELTCFEIGLNFHIELLFEKIKCRTVA
jgi:hypothetical protein